MTDHVIVAYLNGIDRSYYESIQINTHIQLHKSRCSLVSLK